MDGNNTKPLFSVIIPVYNKGGVVKRAIDSVLSQSFDDFEVIVVLDPSTDASSEIVKSLSDDRLRVYERDKPGAGGYAARNLGIEMATGKWIAFLDADDEWFDFSLLKHNQLIQKYDASMVCTSWQESDQHGLITNSRPVSERVLELVDFYQAYAKEERLLNTNTISVKKELFDRCGGFPVGKYLRGGDVATWIKLAYAAGSVICSSVETAIYHREDSTVTKKIVPQIENNPVYDVCRDLANNEYRDFTMQKSLRKLSNRHIRYGLVCRAKDGSLCLSDMKYYSFIYSPFDYLVFLIWAVLPKKAGVFLADISLMMKRFLF